MGFRSVWGMSALQDLEGGRSAADAGGGRLDEILDELAAVVADSTRASDAARIDRIARLEKLRAVTAALQAAESVRFAQSQEHQKQKTSMSSSPPMCTRMPIGEKDRVDCGMGSLSGTAMNTARDRVRLPDTYSQLTAGELSKRVAETIAAETLNRRSAAKSISNSKPGISNWDSGGNDPQRSRSRISARLRRAGPHRTQTSPGRGPVGPDTMTILTGYLPVEQGVACSALRQHADTTVATGDSRTRIDHGRPIVKTPQPPRRH